MDVKLKTPPKRISKKQSNNYVQDLKKRMLFDEEHNKWKSETQGFLGKYYKYESYSKKEDILTGYVPLIEGLGFVEREEDYFLKNPLFEKEFKKYNVRVFVNYVKKEGKDIGIIFVYAKKKTEFSKKLPIKKQEPESELREYVQKGYNEVLKKLGDIMQDRLEEKIQSNEDKLFPTEKLFLQFKELRYDKPFLSLDEIL